MKMTKLSGAAIAASAFSLVLAGAVAAPTPAEAQTVKCFGANACKGQNACKSSKNACKGTNACKGQGWVAMSKAECDALATSKRGMFRRSS
jgi:uncharacterized membrane protein